MNAPLPGAPLSSRVPPPHDVCLDFGRQEAFKAAMRQLAGGVSIVTAALGEERGGLAVTSVTSFSAEPPSLLVSIHQKASAMALLRRSGRFAVSVLGHGHQAVADRFAGRDGSRGAARFAGFEWVTQPGCPPVLADAIASFECDIEDMIDRFSHTVIIGRVAAARTLGGDGALVYWRANYAKLGASR